MITTLLALAAMEPQDVIVTPILGGGYMTAPAIGPGPEYRVTPMGGGTYRFERMNPPPVGEIFMPRWNHKTNRSETVRASDYMKEPR